MHYMKIIFTGPIGIGKSTALHLTMQRLALQTPHGYFTFKEAGSIVLQTWHGKRRVCAQRTAAGQSVSFPYKPDLEVFNYFAAGALACIEDGGFAAIDELGIMELPAEQFVGTVAKLFRRSARILAVVQQRALDAWIEIIGRECVDRLIILDIENRDKIPGMITELMQAGDLLGA